MDTSSRTYRGSFVTGGVEATGVGELAVSGTAAGQEDGSVLRGSVIPSAGAASARPVDVRETRAAPALSDQAQMLADRFARTRQDRHERAIGVSEPVRPVSDVVGRLWAELDEAQAQLAQKDEALTVAGGLLADSISLIDRYRAALAERGVTIEERTA